MTARYERQVTRLEARIERLEEKLRESSDSSSRPPSTDPPGKSPQPKDSSPRKQGAQLGHEGTTRKLVAENLLDQVFEHWPERCAGCGPAAVAMRTARRIPDVEIKTYDCGHFEPYIAPYFEGVVADQLDFLQRTVPSS